MLFIDLEQAFDSVNRRKQSEAMEDVGIPQTLITLIEMTLRDRRQLLRLITGKLESLNLTRG
jgi:hypothetical protein